MKRTIRENVNNLPYGLHDSHISRIKIKELDEFRAKVKLMFREEDAEANLFYGKILFENVDVDFSSICIYTAKGRKYEKIRGRRYTLSQFCRKFKEVDMEVIQETYGFNKTKLTGYMYEKREMKEFSIELYHLGDMIYLTEN